SFEIYLQCFGQDEHTGISRAVVRGLFPVLERESEHNYWLVGYGDNNSCSIDVTPAPSDDARLTSLCIHRPCPDPGLWEGLGLVLRMGAVVASWPGSPPLVAGDAIGTSLPKDMRDAIGPPKSVGSAADILRLLHES